ncbi:pyridoxamine 5'-phosphate oxidase [Ceratobasidium sp. AG-I]|nr:pyridoxamine 5'-phosphate oxidase [Ceratobasidium sp. AG-I]
MDVVISPEDVSKLRVVSRTQYESPSRLSPFSVLPNPMDEFKQWFKATSPPPGSNLPSVKEPEAMAVSTCSAEGVPSTRFVLLKQADARGFVFYTNYTSRKSQELRANPFASIAFYWRELHRQVRVVGRAEQVDTRESDEYYASRPPGSRMGAWASPQSTVVHEEELAQRLAEVEKRFDGADKVPRPEFWGGWRVVPQEIEFWQGQPSRLHDRVRYTRKEGSESKWVIDRLAP